MSTYSLEILDAEKYKIEFDENIRYSFEQYLYKKHFKVGEGIKNEKELKHDLILSRILCSDRCEIVNYIKDTIEGRLQSPHKKKKKRSLLEMFEEHEHQNLYNSEDQKLYWFESKW